MALKKITEADLAGKGVIGMPDTPNLSAREMQEKVEEVVRDVVIPLFNSNVDRTASKQDLAEAVFSAGSGNMNTAIYDTDKDGVVDKAKTAETATSADNGIHTYTHTKSGTVHNLTGAELKETIGNIKFVAVADWNPGDTLTINGINARCHNTLMERVENDVLFKQYARLELTVAYTVNGYYSCFFKSGGGVPDGLTALPVNNVLIWQRCAGLKTSYTTAAQVLADTATLKTLINSANAMEYLIRSTTIQEAVLANANAVSILDKSMPVITPSMKSTSSPYGTVTKADGHFNTGVYKAFNYTEIGTNNSDGSAYSGQPGGWVQYNFSGDRPVWLYKSQIRPTYVNTSGVVMRMQGVLADGTVVRLSDDFSVGALANGYNATPTQVMHIANSHKCVAVRFYVYSGGTIYFNGGKVWGK